MRNTALDTDRTQVEAFSIAHLLHTLGRYLPAMTVALLAVVVGYAIIALAAYVTAPTTEITSVPFRLQFSGAELRQYPNGTKFSPADIVNAPILSRVYSRNNLKRFTTFPEFKSQVFILESNHALQLLSNEYQAKLADPKLTPIDRDRLEREFQAKSESLAHNEYSLNFLQIDSRKSIPGPVVEKVLQEILFDFADQAMKDRGGLDYRVPVVTKSIFSDVRPETAPNIAIAADILRTKIDKAIWSIDQISRVPGAEVLRTNRDQVSLPEVRSRFEDILRFRLQPLTRRLAASEVDNRADVRSFIDAQLQYNRLRAQESKNKEEVLRTALAAYQREEPMPDAGTLENETSQTSKGGSVTPQISESFIDRIVQMSQQTRDVEYRQKAIDRIIDESMTLVPLESETVYYQELLTAYGGGSGNPISAPQARQELVNAYRESLATVNLLGELYSLLSRNLNPGNVMYTMTAPPDHRRTRTIPARKLLLFGGIVMLLSIPLIVAGALIHNRVREEDRADIDASAAAH